VTIQAQSTRKRKQARNLPSVTKKDTEGVQLELTAFFQTREQLGIQIATSGDSIIKITKNHYKVRSQSENRWYNVKK
jgi:hypothetical protein